MKTSLNSNRNDWDLDHNIIDLDCHIYSLHDEDGLQGPDNRPVVGFSYQSFLKGNLFVSLVRPSEIKKIQHHASLGQKLYTMSLLHLADCHIEILQTLLAEGRVTSEPYLGFSLPQVAMLHIGAGNDELGSLICIHLVRQGNARQVLHDSAKEIFDDEEIAELFLEKILPIVGMAESVVQHERLNRKLVKKSAADIKQVKI